MVGRIKKEFEFSSVPQATEPEAQKSASEPQSSEPEVRSSEPVVQTMKSVVQTGGVKVTRIEGFVTDVLVHIESLPAGEIPVAFTYEDQNVRVMGRGIFLLVTKFDPTSLLKCKAIEAMGLEKLNEKLQATDLTKVADIFIIPAQVNKRTQMTQYLAILVGE